jgi:hypothetical protein
MPGKNELKHMPSLIAVCFAANFILGISGGGFEMFSKQQALSWAIANLFYMSGCILFSIKLADEKHFISAAGFILLGIGQGIFYVVQSKLTHASSDYNEYMMGMLALLPGFIFICWYEGFPIWLRVFGILSYIPFGIASLMIWKETYDFKKDWGVDGTGYFLTNITAVIWSYYALRPGKNKHADTNPSITQVS